MEKTTTHVRALSELAPRIKTVCEQCTDLLERDLSAAKARCLREQCKRIWERLELSEREVIRSSVDDPFFKSAFPPPSSYVDYRCIELLGKYLQETGMLERGRS